MPPHPAPTKLPEYQDDLRRGTDYFAVLGVSETATAAEILSAFRSRIKAVHPDQNDGEGDRETLELLVRARRTLMGPERPFYEVERLIQATVLPPASSPKPTPAEPPIDATWFWREWPPAHEDSERGQPRSHAAPRQPPPATPPPASTQRPRGPGPRHSAPNSPSASQASARAAEAAREAAAAASKTREDLRTTLDPEVEIRMAGGPHFTMPHFEQPHFTMPHFVPTPFRSIPFRPTTPYRHPPYRPPGARRPAEDGTAGAR